jgi:hypothetical protein
VRYLNPALSTGSRLFGELTRDNGLVRDFLVDSSALVTALGERRDDLPGVVRNLNAPSARWGASRRRSRSRSGGFRRSCGGLTPPSSTCAPRWERANSYVAPNA